MVITKETEIKTWIERCNEHPDHDGIVSNQMIMDRMQEEIDELRQLLIKLGYIDIMKERVYGQDE
jgi:hypothetical protein